MKPVYIVFRRTLSASKRQALFIICATNNTISNETRVPVITHVNSGSTLMEVILLIDYIQQVWSQLCMYIHVGYRLKLYNQELKKKI